jgi:myo-inositol-1(or 4)-monophosphatase
MVGVIYQPITNELFTCSRGQGAYLNGKRIYASRVNHLSSSLLATGFPSRKRTRNPNILYCWNLTLRSHGVRRDGSSALDLASVACGRFDGFFEFGLHPWDSAAGVLLVREAGGTVTNLSGQPYRLGEYEILASNGHIHEEMLRVASSVPVQLADSPDEESKPGAPEQ